MARKPPASSRPVAGDVRRGGGLWRMPDLLGRLLDPAARRRGLAEATLLSEWAAVVGAGLAARAQPVKLTGERGARGGATLVLHCSSAAALELQHAEIQLLERINDHFGYPAVARLRLIQAPPARRVKRRPGRRARALAEAEIEAIEKDVAPLADAELRAALARLGRTLKAQIDSPGDGSPGGPARTRDATTSPLRPFSEG